LTPAGRYLTEAGESATLNPRVFRGEFLQSKN
jgi:hypothetical protein